MAVGEAETRDFALEDLFPEDYYLKKVKEIYDKELAATGATKLTLKGSDLLCNKVARALADAGIALPPGTKEKAERLIGAINAAFTARILACSVRPDTWTFSSRNRIEDRED